MSSVPSQYFWQNFWQIQVFDKRLLHQCPLWDPWVRHHQRRSFQDGSQSPNVYIEQRVASFFNCTRHPMGIRGQNRHLIQGGYFRFQLQPRIGIFPVGKVNSLHIEKALKVWRDYHLLCWWRSCFKGKVSVWLLQRLSETTEKKGVLPNPQLGIEKWAP